MSSDLHRCPGMEEAHQQIHSPTFRFGCGEAIDRIEWTEFGWWAYSINGGEYATKITFCPFCGLKL